MFNHLFSNVFTSRYDIYLYFVQSPDIKHKNTCLVRCVQKIQNIKKLREQKYKNSLWSDTISTLKHIKNKK